MSHAQGEVLWLKQVKSCRSHADDFIEADAVSLRLRRKTKEKSVGDVSALARGHDCRRRDDCFHGLCVCVRE